MDLISFRAEILIMLDQAYKLGMSKEITRYEAYIDLLNHLIPKFKGVENRYDDMAEVTEFMNKIEEFANREKSEREEKTEKIDSYTEILD